MPEPKSPAEIEDIATDWVAKVQRGLSPEEQASLDQWLDSNSRHLGAFVRAQAAWIHAERATALGSMPLGEADSEPVDQPLEVSVSDDLAEFRRPSRRRFIVGGGGALAASAAAACFFAFDRHRTLESGVGEIRRLTLAGGTVLTLDTDTRVDIALSSADKLLTLVRGKIFLTVMQQQESPLTVRVGDLALETLKGAFGLQSVAAEPVIALVTEGILRASQSQGLFGQKRAVAIEKDHALTLSRDTPLAGSDVRLVAAPRQVQLLAWRDGMLSFGGETLGEAVRAFDRYSTARISVEDGPLSRQRVTGLFKADDPAGFARAVAVSFGGVVSIRGDVIQIASKKSASG